MATGIHTSLCRKNLWYAQMVMSLRGEGGGGQIVSAAGTSSFQHNLGSEDAWTVLLFKMLWPTQIS